MLKIAVSTSHVVVGIFLIVYSNIDHINITLPFSLIMCCNTVLPGKLMGSDVTCPGWGEVDKRRAS